MLSDATLLKSRQLKLEPIDRMKKKTQKLKHIFFCLLDRLFPLRADSRLLTHRTSRLQSENDLTLKKSN
jgi:hypothetical protein